MQKANPVLTLPRVGGAYAISPNPLWYPTPEEIVSGEIRGEITARGPWQTISAYRAVAISGRTWDGEPLTVWGMRTLTNAQESGYDLEGRVSINGKSYRGFTSSILLELPDGKLLSVATIHVCIK